MLYERTDTEKKEGRGGVFWSISTHELFHENLTVNTSYSV